MEDEILKRKISFLIILMLIGVGYSEHKYFHLSSNQEDIIVLFNETEDVFIKLSGILYENVNLTFIKQHPNICDIQPDNLQLNTEDTINNISVVITGRKVGHSEVFASMNPNYDWIKNDIILRVTVANAWSLYYISKVVGWLYFVAWSISFYPQIFSNWKRKSVVGLNFDFLSLNLCGFTLYSIFNIGLFFIPEIQAEYSKRYPQGLNPIMTNDIFFSVHAIFATILTVIQCFIYERADQRVSNVARSILLVFSLLLIVSAILVAAEIMHWLDFLYICSYIKLAITLIKYIPQAIMNYKRKSTVGWSIGNIILDFIGGLFSMLQMILNAYNYDDWISIFGDPTKFGLGLFSVCFDIFFMLQHYLFYSPKKTLSTNPLCESETGTTGDSDYENKN